MSEKSKVDLQDINMEDNNLKMIDSILKTTLTAIESGKQQIFDISDGARSEVVKLKNELGELNAEAAEIVDQVDALEVKYRHSRNHLSMISKNFHTHSEADIKKAYEQANQHQIDLMLAREREQQIRKRRDELQIRQKNLGDTIEKADKFATQMGAVLGYLSGDLTNITDALETAQQKQLLAIKVIQSQEEERKRLARDIHDGPAQLLANVVLRAEICERLMGLDTIKAKDELTELKENARRSLVDVRKIIFDLRPMTLDDLGLVPTVRKYLEQFEERTRIRGELTVIGKVEDIESTVVVAAFRIIQECLNNVEKHADATQVTIKLEFLKKDLNIVVTDNGVGFDVDVALKSQRADNFGLIGMFERVKLLEGRLQIDSSIGKGSRFYIQLPYELED